MKKLLIMQKVMFVIYIIAMVALFLYSLGFMTQYRDFQYLASYENYVLYEFHHERLIPYNNFIFNLAIVSIVTILIVFSCKYNKKLPNLVTTVIGILITIPTIISSVYSLKILPGLKKDYQGFDFSYVPEETYEPYTPSTLAFDIGEILSIALIIIMVLFIAILVVNCIAKYTSEAKGKKRA